eukprot:TRINITY_DN21268_c0_g1_i2.p2 TRINITY_DN21268_c0_g1~~TRINITY_DN21268_c0_g1_i2.p2  ORF type:complete len:120 (+),score=9.12 TRINITY_DN21268_c0_g1_i2:678-1037(+)
MIWMIWRLQSWRSRPPRRELAWVCCPTPKRKFFNEAFNATFWIETVNGEHGKVKYQQLQYAQTVNMDFKVKFKPHCQTSNAPLDCLIKWPHVQVNTLRKLPPFDPCEIYTCAEGLPPIR